jgi:hypothetical protein
VIGGWSHDPRALVHDSVAGHDQNRSRHAHGTSLVRLDVCSDIGYLGVVRSHSDYRGAIRSGTDDLRKIGQGSETFVEMAVRKCS